MTAARNGVVGRRTLAGLTLAWTAAVAAALFAAVVPLITRRASRSDVDVFTWAAVFLSVLPLATAVAPGITRLASIRRRPLAAILSGIALGLLPSPPPWCSGGKPSAPSPGSAGSAGRWRAR